MKSSTLAHWNRFWRQPDPRIATQKFNPKLIHALVVALGTPVGKRILEAGCGTALDSIQLTKLGAEVIAYDFSMEAIGAAKGKAAAEGFTPHFAQGDIQFLPYADHTFDAVFHSGVLEHFRTPTAILGEQRRVLKPAGVLLVDVPQTFNLYTIDKARQIHAGVWFAGWETQYSLGQLKAMLQSEGFEVIGAYGYGYYPAIFAKARWLSSLGKSIFGRSVMPEPIARRYNLVWERFERTHSFLYVAQCIGVVSRRME